MAVLGVISVASAVELGVAVGVDDGGACVLLANDPTVAVGWGEIMMGRGEFVDVGVEVGVCAVSARHTSSKVISGGGSA